MKKSDSKQLPLATASIAGQAPGQFNLDPASDNYCVMGNPVSHSKSPRIHQAFAEQTRQSLVYQAIQVDDDDFPRTLDSFQAAGGKGLNITVPFKGDAWRSVDVASPRADKSEAVNTIWFAEDGTRHGDTTDGVGLVRDLSRHEILLQSKRILLLGAGGAVRGVLASLLDEAPAELMLVNRTVARAEALLELFRGYPALKAGHYESLFGQRFDILINGTSASFNGELLPLPADILAQGACCYDMVYADTDTVFNHWARQHGAAIVLDGLGMLVEQAAESFFIWRGIRPETRSVIEMLRSVKRKA